MKGVLVAVGGVLVGGFVFHLIALILILSWFWSDGFLYDTVECFIGLVATAICSVSLRMFIPKIIELGEFRARKPQRKRKIVFRFAMASIVCLLCTAYCASIVYFGLVQPGHKTPVFVVYSLWMISFFPMMFFMTRALRGVYYDGPPIVGGVVGFQQRSMMIMRSSDSDHK